MSNDRQARLAQCLSQILQTLARDYHPEKVILFGSMASGVVREWSDLDLAIIKETSLPFLQRLKEVALLCRAPVGVDYLVYTPEEFAEMVQRGNPFILEEVVRKGKVLYEQRPVGTVA